MAVVTSNSMGSKKCWHISRMASVAALLACTSCVGELQTDESDFARLGPSLSQDISNDRFIVQKLSNAAGQVYWRERDRTFILRSGPDVITVSPQGEFSQSREEGRSGRNVDERTVRPAFKSDNYYSHSWCDGSRPIQVVDFVKTSRQSAYAYILRNVGTYWTGVAQFSLTTKNGTLRFSAPTEKRIWTLFSEYQAYLEVFFPPGEFHDHVILQSSDPNEFETRGAYHVRLRNPERK
jgi:hypothetical protein